jgi:hypothetical protein
MLQRRENVLTMSLRQVGDSRRQRADEVLHPFGSFTVGRRCSLKERLECHADDRAKAGVPGGEMFA